MAKYGYVPTEWVQDGLTEYGEANLKNIENFLVYLDNNENGSNGMARKQTVNMAKALKKLRSNEATEICFMGDSVFYAYDMYTKEVQEDCVPDNGSPLTGYYRSSVTIYDSFMDVMNKTYENKITLKKKVYTGQSVERANKEWNASTSDVIIMNYGINDALGTHIASSYRGKVDLFIEEYRKLIERELNNGTAVIVLSPTKLTSVVGADDTDNRTLVDLYEQAIINVCIEYGIPCINGNDMIKNFGNDLAVDFCHFTKEGFRAIGYRLASVLIGQSPNNPMWVSDGSYLGVNPQLDNVNIVNPAILESDVTSPNIPAMISSGDLEAVVRVDGGLQANISGNGRVVWSFYCEHDGMVVVPSLTCETVGAEIEMKLDFGAVQGKWNNSWNHLAGTINRDYNEPSVVKLINSDLTANSGKSYGLHCLTSESQPALKITSKGWHTIEISAKFPKGGEQPASIIPDENGQGNVLVYGINFMSINNYNMLMRINRLEQAGAVK